jgi:TatD DNase family protein
VIDSHCHLADEAFAADLDEVIDRARQCGVERALVIVEAGRPDEEARAARVLARWPEIVVSIGVHPHAAHRYDGRAAEAAAEVRRQIARTPAARAVGEIGLDYHYDFSPRAIQQDVFRAQVQCAREIGRPLVIHTREADADTMRILTEEGASEVGGVLHCFTGDSILLKAGLDLGFYISLAGIVTFPKAAELRATAKLVPLDRLLVETDGPFLAPVPHRGRRNEPAFVSYVVDALAGIHGVAPADLAAATVRNFHALFGP